MSESTNRADGAGCSLDPLVNKTIDFAYRGARLKFDLSHALFSSFDVDAGTRLLLKEIANEPGVTGARRVLDAGCGTGIIGLSLAASCPDMELVMRDRDFRAVAFSARNAARNGIEVELYGLGGAPLEQCHKGRFAKVKIVERRAPPVIVEPGALGEPDARGPYDAVISNLPAKAGEKVLARFFRIARSVLLKPGGTFAFVIVTPLAERARAWCADAGLTLVRTTSTKNHMVAIARVPGAEEPEAGASLPPVEAPSSATSGKKPWLSYYERSRVKMNISGADLAWRGILGLPEFDEPSYATVCALSLAREVCAGHLVRRALVIEPGVGVASLWIRTVLGPDEIVLKSHDTLALKSASYNLGLAGYDGCTSVLEPCYAERSGVPSEVSDMAATTADREKKALLADSSIDAVFLFAEDIPNFDGAAFSWSFASKVLKRGGVMVVVAKSTQIERFIRQKPQGFSKSPFTERKKGWEAIAFELE